MPTSGLLCSCVRVFSRSYFHPRWDHFLSEIEVVRQNQSRSVIKSVEKRGAVVLWFSFTVEHCWRANPHVFRNASFAVLSLGSGMYSDAGQKRMINIMFYTLWPYSSLHTLASAYLFFISKLDTHALQYGTWKDMPLLFTCLVSWGHAGRITTYMPD